MTRTPLPVSSRPSMVPPLDAEMEPAIAFILALAQALHAYGASAHRLEGMLTLVAMRLGIEARFYSTPTAVMASFGPVTAGRTCLVRVLPADLNLEKLSLLHATAIAVIRGKTGLDAGSAEVQRIVAATPRYQGWGSVLAYAASSGSAATFFGAGRNEVLAATAVGTVVGVLSRLLARHARGFSLVEPVAALCAAVAAALAARLLGPLSTLVVTLAGIVTLLPGLSVTTAMNELATRNLASGTARFAGAIVQLLGLGFGVAIGAKLAVALLPSGPPMAPVDWPVPALALAVVVASVSFGVLLRAAPRDLPIIVVAGAVAFGGARAGAHLFGPEIGAFSGALAVAMGSNAYARTWDRPAPLTLVPGLLVLVPGSIGFRSVFSMLESDVVSGVTAAFQMVLVAVALAGGILLANIAVPPRRPL
ncbi:MAG: threonine/serine exporter family protein [Polyangiaceae bacterium]